MDPHRLTTIDGPWLHSVIATPTELSNQVRALEEKSIKRLVARVVRGRKARTKSALMDEFAAALQFPLDFGENWDALNDSLGDLDWLRAESFVLILVDAQLMLAEGPAEDWMLLLKILEQAATHGRHAGGKYKTRTYHAVLHAPSEEAAALTHRCRLAGVIPQAL